MNVVANVPTDAFDRIGSALVEIGQVLRDLAREEKRDDDDPVERLWNRLGIETQKFLYELALDFPPESGPFDLASVSERLGLSPASARARMMAVGRSSRALGMSAPRLWTSERDPQTRRRRYAWDPTARASLIRLVEG
jgi:hypothetical protein